MKIVETIPQDECNQLILELKNVEFIPNDHGWHRDHGHHLEKRYGYSFSGEEYKEILVKDLTNNEPLVWVEDMPSWLLALRNKYFPEANSVLLSAGFHPETTTSVGWHTDSGRFKPKAVLVNLGVSEFTLRPNTIQPLNMGDVLEFDSVVFHRSEQKSDNRYTIVFRQTQENYPVVQ